MTKDNCLLNAQSELQAGEDALRVARACTELGTLRDAMSRVYYAAFHAARALLLLDGLEPKTHGGVARMLGERWVRPGRLDPKFGLALTRLQAYRQAADYSYSFEATLDDVNEEIGTADALLAAARAAIAAGPAT
ncbi:MAG: HEPN domain-containing protein [Polyangiaceae bacterium]|nr:HEPN domain-containing protein [Polyangiaceae bacterium]